MKLEPAARWFLFFYVALVLSVLPTAYAGLSISTWRFWAIVGPVVLVTGLLYGLSTNRMTRQ